MLESFIHRQFKAFVACPEFACLGAKAAVRTGNYEFHLYPDLGSSAMNEDLENFAARHWPVIRSFVAAFEFPKEFEGEAGFERRLWMQLQYIHDNDFYAWSKKVSHDPYSPRFAFCAAGEPYFVIGMGPVSSRYSRRFGWPLLVFNPIAMFEELRKRGRFGKMRDVTRHRDAALQGEINPMVADFGHGLVAPQFSGRVVEPDWRCPFVYKS